jgi:peptide/nickel transport system substrate-binding protein
MNRSSIDIAGSGAERADYAVGVHELLTRRTTLRLLVVTVGAGLLTACGPAQPVSPTATITSAPAAAPTTLPLPATSVVAATTATPPTSRAALQPRSGGTLRTANSTDIASLDPMLLSGNAMDTSWLAFDRLASYDEELKPQPLLAESWDISPDYTQFKLNLRKGVQFHTGREFTSDDVAYSLQRARDPKVGNGVLPSMANWFSSVETPDKFTVVLKSDSPRPAFFDGLDVLNICDKDTLEGPNARSTAVGTGPFVLNEWVQGDHFSLVKNPNYWLSGRPYLDGIVAYIRPQPNMAVQLEAGVLDLIKSPLVQDYDRIKNDASYTAAAATNTGTFFEIGANTQTPPLNDKRVRQAMNYALDRERFAGVILKGTATTINLPWSQSSPAYDASRNNVYPFDLDRSRALLQEAGVTGFETNIFVPGSAQPELLAFCQVFQANLATLGITLNVRNLEPAVISDLINNNKPEYVGFHATNDNWSSMTPATLFSLSTAWRTANNRSKFSNDVYTGLAAAVASETEPARQKQAYAAMNDYMLDESFTMSLCTYPITYITTTRVHGVEYLRHLGAFSFTNVWME